MEIFKTKNEVIKKVENLKNSGKKIGFVPTMGALHSGHLSLVQESKKQTDVTFVSIFVNPTQFNNPDDLIKYPRTVDTDITKLESINTDFLFLPDVIEMYPEPDNRVFDFDNLDKVMEGKYRKGHFNGVAQIVSKLFEIVRPDKSFFGLKDYQQYLIVKKLVEKYLKNLNIEIIGCPIKREENGLAMSSRNELLSKENRQNAGLIFNTLFESVKDYRSSNIEQLRENVINKINSSEFLKVEYFEIVNSENLMPIDNTNTSEKAIGCIAVFCGSVRLIDNVFYN